MAVYKWLKFYRTLSEIKAEVEAVIKSGRRAADGAPDLSRRVDQLKELYNRLGAQVTDAKGKLEGALLHARELHADLAELAPRLDALVASPAPRAVSTRTSTCHRGRAGALLQASCTPTWPSWRRASTRSWPAPLLALWSAAAGELHADLAELAPRLDALVASPAPRAGELERCCRRAARRPGRAGAAPRRARGQPRSSRCEYTHVHLSSRASWSAAAGELHADLAELAPRLDALVASPAPRAGELERCCRRAARRPGRAGAAPRRARGQPRSSRCEYTHVHLSSRASWSAAAGELHADLAELAPRLDALVASPAPRAGELERCCRRAARRPGRAGAAPRRARGQPRSSRCEYTHVHLSSRASWSAAAGELHADLAELAPRLDALVASPAPRAGELERCCRRAARRPGRAGAAPRRARGQPRSSRCEYTHVHLSSRASWSAAAGELHADLAELAPRLDALVASPAPRAGELERCCRRAARRPGRAGAAPRRARGQPRSSRCEYTHVHLSSRASWSAAAGELHADLAELAPRLDALVASPAPRAGASPARQALELELSRLEATHDRLNANYRHFAELCEPTQLQELKQQVDAINQRWDEARRRAGGPREPALRRLVADADAELAANTAPSAARLTQLEKELRGRAAEVAALDDAALTATYDRLLQKIENIDEIQKFWEIEEVAEQSELSSEDQQCIDFYQSTTQRREDGRYEDIQNLIIKWRQHRFAFTADLEKMFRQIWLSEKDQDLQRIMWRDHPTDQLREYKLSTVTYGTKAAPFLAMMTLKQLAQDERPNFQNSSAPSVLEESFYMDDLIHGSHSLEAAKQLQNDMINLLKSGGFHLRKWKSNAPELLEGAAARPVKEEALEYEKVTDTIKRRLESPVDTPDTEKPELKKSKIPLALNSPVPIRREVKEGGCRSRGSSLERVKSKAGSPCADSLVSGMSFDSIEPPPSLPSTPGTPKKDSSTFNLLKDSDLFTQISKNKIEPSEPKPVLDDKPKVSPCHVVAIKEHEIVKATVSSPEPASNIETAVEFVPQRVETVEIVDDTEGDSASASSDSEEKQEVNRRPSVDLGSEPKTFVVEVRTLEQRMRPTLGVIMRKSAEDNANVPDLIPSVEKRNDLDFSTQTPPCTPMEEGDMSPLDDAALKRNIQHVREDEANEYLILEDAVSESIPSTGDSSPSTKESSPSIKESIPSTKKPSLSTKESSPSTEVSSPLTKEVDTAKAEEKVDVPEYTYPSDSSAKSADNETTSNDHEEEAIYSEVEETAQTAASPGAPLCAPLCASTPVRAATVVGVSHKAPASPVSPVPPSPVASPVAEKYQRTDDFDDSVESAPTPTAAEAAATAAESEAAAGALRARFGRGADAGACAWAGRAAAMCRRMDVMLLTLAAAAAERDPGKRLEILKNQLGAIAPDAAELISHGDSLVYDKHKDDPLLADYIQTHYQDKLRNKWSVVMSEIETKRNLAMKAEDDIKELARLTEQLRAAAAAGPPDETEAAALEAAAERAAALARDLRAQRVAFDERALAEALASWNKITEAQARDSNQKPDGVEIRAAELVTRVNRVRECVAGARALLRAPPLGARDYDDFPLQEDALARVKTALAEATSSCEECEKEFSWVQRRARPETKARAARLRDKMNDELKQLNEAFEERREKWSKCQGVWAGLYAALEQCGEWLDGCERALAAAAAPSLPFKDLKQKVRDLDQQMTSRRAQVEAARAGGRAVVGACGVPLARDVQDQLDALNERWHAAHAALHHLNTRTSWTRSTSAGTPRTPRCTTSTPGMTSRRAQGGACGVPLARDVQDQLDALNERWHAAHAALHHLNTRGARAACRWRATCRTSWTRSTSAGTPRTPRCTTSTPGMTSRRAQGGACGVPLARDVQDQLDALNERWHAAHAALHHLNTRISATEATAVMREGGSAWAGGARAQLQLVRDLLLHTSPNPSDHTSLAIRLSLVKVSARTAAAGAGPAAAHQPQPLRPHQPRHPPQPRQGERAHSCSWCGTCCCTPAPIPPTTPASPSASASSSLAIRLSLVKLQLVRDLLLHTSPNPSDHTSLAIRLSLVKLQLVRDLLLHTSPNPSDHTSLAIRLSLVKLQLVRDLLLHTSPNPSDHTSLAIRLSLVKLQLVRDLLLHTSPNPSDHTSLAIRLSLVKIQ
ncbi:uncharacterized protein LOC135081918 [Ostrinia nubilalis]|uniref:uncharacterized protein LOC135081918 n=1 Tax=Ostrinia nubilalis TaxID=29057 RepID=UPI0030822281